MSWDSYLDNLVVHSKDATGATHIDKCCIIGLDGGGKWTTDAHPQAFKLDSTECANIARCFKAKDFSVFMHGGGIRAEGTTYLFLREEDNKIVYGKNKGKGAITVQASKTALIVAHCPEGGQQGNTNKGVAAIAEYLESLGM